MGRLLAEAPGTPSGKIAALRGSALDFASIYARLNDQEKTIEFLEAAYRQRAPRLIWLNARAIWDPVRPNPQFQSLLQRMGFPR